MQDETYSVEKKTGFNPLLPVPPSRRGKKFTKERKMHCKSPKNKRGKKSRLYEVKKLVTPIKRDKAGKVLKTEVRKVVFWNPNRYHADLKSALRNNVAPTASI